MIAESLQEVSFHFSAATLTYNRDDANIRLWHATIRPDDPTATPCQFTLDSGDVPDVPEALRLYGFWSKGLLPALSAGKARRSRSS
jgi:hypothetical protein